MIGPNPLYMPRIPSSAHITLAVPTKPLYTLVWPLLSAAASPPCAWSFVLMTSSGQVTMPEVKPPMAPDRALNCESEAWVAHRSTSVSRPGVCIVSITAAVVGIICAACVVSSLSECGYFLSHSAEWVDTGSGGSWWLSCDMPAPTRRVSRGTGVALGGSLWGLRDPWGWSGDAIPVPSTAVAVFPSRFDVDVEVSCVVRRGSLLRSGCAGKDPAQAPKAETGANVGRGPCTSSSGACEVDGLASCLLDPAGEAVAESRAKGRDRMGARGGCESGMGGGPLREKALGVLAWDCSAVVGAEEAGHRRLCHWGASHARWKPGRPV